MAFSEHSRVGERSAASALGVGRGLAIIVVMYGHALAPWVIGAGQNFSQEAFLQYKLGGSFLMAFFFFVSGLAWRETTTLKSAWRQSIALILIAWASSAVLEAVRVPISWAGLSEAFGQNPATVWSFVKSCVRSALLADRYAMSTMWFLTALALIRLIATYASRYGRWAIAAATIALLAASFSFSFFGWRNVYQIWILGVGFACFMGGHAAGAVFARLERKPLAALAVAALSCAVLFATYQLNLGCTFDYARQCGWPWLNGQFAVAMAVGVYGYLPLFVLTAASGVAFATAMSILIARFTAPLGWRLAVIGRNTVALLIVNGALLEWLHPMIVRLIAPRVNAEGVVFFLTLFAATLTLNLVIAALLRRPLKEWIGLAGKIAGFIVEAPRRWAPKIWGMRRDRVSEAREQPRA